jgi:hypothetical protein
MTAVRHLCAENRKFQGGDEKPEIIDAKYPQFSRMWFIFSLGLTKTHTQKTEKRLEGVTDLKNLAQLQQAKIFMEGMGIEDAENLTSGTHIEGEKVAELKKTLELLKLSYLAHCQEIVEISSCCVHWMYINMCIHVYYMKHVYLCVCGCSMDTSR